MLIGKEKKKRKKEQIYKVKEKQIKKIYIHPRLTASRSIKQRNKCRKNNNWFKKLKIKIKKGKRKKKASKQKNSPELQKSNTEAEFITTIKNVSEKKKRKKNRAKA